MKIKIFGERNTSTNAVKQMIAANSESVLHSGGLLDFSAAERGLVRLAEKSGLSTASIEKLKDQLFAVKPLVKQWKHCATNFTDVDIARCEGTHFVFVVRHPASWVLSLYKNPYQSLQDTGETLEQFLETEWRTVGREKLGRRSFRPLDLYQEKIASYIRFIEKLDRASLTHSLVRFEDMILRQEACYKHLSPFLDRPNIDFLEVKKSTKDTVKNLDYYKDYYGNRHWKHELSHAFFSKTRFDSDLLRWMGYDWECLA